MLRSHGLPASYREIETGDHVLGNVPIEATDAVLGWLRAIAVLRQVRRPLRGYAGAAERADDRAANNAAYWEHLARSMGHRTARWDAAGSADALPAGQATQLGPSWPGGGDLSVGQWQERALDRAILRTGLLLLPLDEPTAALDADTQHRLFERWIAAARSARRPER